MTPASGLPQDKVLHLSAYFLLGLLVALSWQLRGGHLGSVHYVLVWGVLALYGAIDELTQIPVGREASVADWVADMVGAAAGVVAFVALRPRLMRWFCT